MAQAGMIWERRFDIMFAGQGGQGIAEAITSYCASNEGKLDAKMFEIKLLKWAKSFES